MQPVVIVHGGAGPARGGDDARDAERVAALERGGAICVSAAGDIAMPCTDARMNRAWRTGAGPVHSAVAAA